MQGTVIALAGTSCAYKSSVARKLEARGLCKRLRLDRYYLGDEHVPERDGLKDFEDPTGLDLALAAEHVRLLVAGKPADLPVYSKDLHARVSHERFVLGPGENLLVEGLHALHPPLLDECNIRLCLDIGADKVQERRRRRKKGLDYTDEYHQKVMCYWLSRFRLHWITQAEFTLSASDDGPGASDRLAYRIENYLKARLPRP